MLMNLKAQLLRLHTALSEKAREFDLVIKIDRTQFYSLGTGVLGL